MSDARKSPRRGEPGSEHVGCPAPERIIRAAMTPIPLK